MRRFDPGRSCWCCNENESAGGPSVRQGTLKCRQNFVRHPSSSKPQELDSLTISRVNLVWLNVSRREPSFTREPHCVAVSLA